MSLYFFRISTGRYSGAADQPYEFEDRAAAWTEMTEVCANLLGSIARNLKPNANGAWSCSTRTRSRSSASAWSARPCADDRERATVNGRQRVQIREFRFIAREKCATAVV